MSVGTSPWIVGGDASQSSQPQLSSLFVCDGCQEQIPAHKARIRCQSCQSFNLCANCFVIGVSAGNHAPHHPTAVIHRSGAQQTTMITHQIPAGRNDMGVMNSNPGGAVLAQRWTGDQSSSSPQISSAATGSPLGQAPYFPPPPPRASYVPPPPPPLSRTSPSHLMTQSPSPALPPRQTPPTVSVGASSAGNWKSLFDGNLPSPTFIALLNDIFTYLDPRGTGYLTPEVYSSFLDVQGYALDHNVWKKSLTPVFGQNKEDIADFEWKSSLDNFSIDYVMAPRGAVRNNDVNSLVAGMNNVYLNSPGVQQIIQASMPKSVSGGQMPLLTRKGFIDITAIEVLYDPSEGWGNLNRALRTYRLWQDKGLIPREMLPAFPPQDILDRVKRIGEMAKLKAQRQIDAKRAETMMKQRGQQYALDLLDDRRYYYY